MLSSAIQKFQNVTTMTCRRQGEAGNPEIMPLLVM
jgi:hypothetical protein